SSRRRHTRFSRDWSSDVCSSDLSAARSAGVFIRPPRGAGLRIMMQGLLHVQYGRRACWRLVINHHGAVNALIPQRDPPDWWVMEIGRAACRGGVMGSDALL